MLQLRKSTNILQNDKASKDNEEKFSKFLYKLDRTNGITKEQRKQFIGIYQMMNIFPSAYFLVNHVP